MLEVPWEGTRLATERAMFCPSYIVGERFNMPYFTMLRDRSQEEDEPIDYLLSGLVDMPRYLE